MDWTELWGIGIIAGAIVAIFLIGSFVSRRGARIAELTRREASGRMEALFKASFPELQPHFHPARVLEFVRARRGRVPLGSQSIWRKPPGFPAAAAAEMELEGLKDRVRLVDAVGVAVAEFVYEEHPEGGVIRMGKGKFTVNLKGPEPRVRYWHPQREFKWTPTSWKLQTSMAEQALQSHSSSDHDYSSDSSSSSSVSRGAAAGAAAGGIVAAGGSFDGGGASAAWDDGGSSSSSGSDSSSGFSSVDSGSSSIASSTGY